VFDKYDKKMNETENDHKIYFDEDLNAVVMKWHGYANSAQFRDGTELMLNTLIKHNCSRVFADLKNMLLIGSEDQQWLTTNFLPRAILFGFRTIAIVNPESYFSKIGLDSVCEGIHKGNLTIGHFETAEEAAGWLNTINRQNKSNEHKSSKTNELS